MKLMKLIKLLLLALFCCPESLCDGAVVIRSELYRVTAYCPCRKCCGQFAQGITASGHVIKHGDKFVAADKKFPFGTEFVIPGYNNSNPVKVLDRGGAIKGNRLDVFFGFDPNSTCTPHEKALEWGVKYLKVKIIKE